MSKVQVTWQDQQNINSFSRLNATLHELEAEISTRKKSVDDLEDASNEFILLDEEYVPFAIGDCFVHLDKDEAEEFVTKEKDDNQDQLKMLEQDVTEIRGKMKELKSILYAKFGNNINLEED